MDKSLIILILLANSLATNCQEENIGDRIEEPSDSSKSAYSFGYGVSDRGTGDVKTMWESRFGDTVKGHYSVREPDGSTRYVEYTAVPDIGFQASIDKEMPDETKVMANQKSSRDYERYDFSEYAEEDYYEKERPKRPLEPIRNHKYTNKKTHKYPSYNNHPLDSEASEYTHSITIKHPQDDASDNEPHSHVGYSFGKNCKTKHKKESHDNREPAYSNFADIEINKNYPQYGSDLYQDHSAESSYEHNRFIKHYDNGRYKGHKYEDYNEKPTGLKYTFPLIPDVPPPEKYYPDDFPSRPKKKRPYKYREPEHRQPIISENLSEYVLVPKKKLKRQPVESYEYRITDDDFDRPQYSDSYEEDDRYQDSGPREIVKKIIKKRKPVNLLDIFDI